MAKKKNEYSISELVDMALQRVGQGDVAVSEQVESAYRRLVGEMIVKLTYRCTYEPKTHVLYCDLASPALRQELRMRATGLIQAINSAIGRNEVHYIVFR